MRILHSVRTLSAIVATAGMLLGIARSDAAETIRTGGTGTASGMLREVGAKFTAETGINVAIVPSLGSSGAIRAVMDGKLDVAVSGRPLKADEQAAGLRQLLALRTPLVIATSRAAAGGLKKTDVAKIYANADAAWPDGTPSRIILRPRSDADSDLLGELFPGMRDALEAARRRPEVPTAATDQDNADLAERLGGSFTATTTTQIKTERRRLHAVTIDGIEPTLENFESGTYPFAKTLYLLAKGEGSSAVAQFVNFLRSPSGRAVLREVEVLAEPK